MIVTRARIPRGVRGAMGAGAGNLPAWYIEAQGRAPVPSPLPSLRGLGQSPELDALPLSVPDIPSLDTTQLPQTAIDFSLVPSVSTPAPTSSPLFSPNPFAAVAEESSPLRQDWFMP